MSMRESLISEINARYDAITEALEDILAWAEDEVHTKGEVAIEIRNLLKKLI